MITTVRGILMLESIQRFGEDLERKRFAFLKRKLLQSWFSNER